MGKGFCALFCDEQLTLRTIAARVRMRFMLLRELYVILSGLDGKGHLADVAEEDGTVNGNALNDGGSQGTSAQQSQY